MPRPDSKPQGLSQVKSRGHVIASTKANKLSLFHQFYEVIEQIIRVVWAGGSFGVVLDGEGRLVFAAESLVRIVVEVQMSQLDLFFFKRIGVYAEAMVLAGDFNLSRFEVLNRVIGTSVAELELVGPGAERQGENLVTEAYSEDGDFAKQFADGFDGVFHRRRVARAVA